MKNPIILFLCTICAIVTNAQVGIGTTSPNTTLDVRGSIAINSRSFSTTSESVSTTDYVLLFTGTSACTLTLPNSTSFPGRLIHIKNTNTGTVPVLTIATTLSQTIDGSSTWLLDDPNETVNVISDGSNWRIMGQSLPSGSGTSWTQGGNTVGSIKKLGTIDNYDLSFITNNVERMSLSSTGLTINGTNKRLTFATPGGDPDAVIEHRSYSGFWDFNEMLFYIGNDADVTYGPDRMRMVAEEFKFQSFNNGGNSSLANAESESNLNTNMLIDANGNVAIGTTTFDSNDPKLQIDAGSGGNNPLTPLSAIGTTNNYLQINVQNLSNGNVASSDIVATANNGSSSTVYIDMGINSQGYSSGSSSILNGSNTAYIYATGSHFYIGNGAQNKDLIFFTNTGATGADGTERARVTSTSFQPGSNNNYSLGTSSLKWTAVHATNGTIQTSDRRLKTNIHRLPYGLKEVMRMHPVEYNWINNPNGEHKIGLIAQDVKQLIPEVVVGDEAKENIGMNYAELVPVLINAIKEQQQQIEELKKKVKRLENK